MHYSILSQEKAFDDFVEKNRLSQDPKELRAAYKHFTRITRKSAKDWAQLLDISDQTIYSWASKPGTMRDEYIHRIRKIIRTLKEVDVITEEMLTALQRLLPLSSDEVQSLLGKFVSIQASAGVHLPVDAFVLCGQSIKDSQDNS